MVLLPSQRGNRRFVGIGDTQRCEGIAGAMLPGGWRLRSEKMANDQKPQAKQLVLGGDGGLGRVHVDIEAFFGFSFWLAEELEDVVARWSKQLPPRHLRPASRPHRDVRRSAK